MHSFNNYGLPEHFHNYLGRLHQFTIIKQGLLLYKNSIFLKMKTCPWVRFLKFTLVPKVSLKFLKTGSLFNLFHSKNNTKIFCSLANTSVHSSFVCLFHFLFIKIQCLFSAVPSVLTPTAHCFCIFSLMLCFVINFCLIMFV